MKAELGKKVDGDYSNLANFCTLTRKDGSEFEAFFKVSKMYSESDFEGKLGRDREAMFFNYLKAENVKFEII